MRGGGGLVGGGGGLATLTLSYTSDIIPCKICVISPLKQIHAFINVNKYFTERNEYL